MRNPSRLHQRSIAAAIVLLHACGASAAFAADAPLRSHVEPFVVDTRDSRDPRAQAPRGAEPSVADVITSPGAPWLHVRFAGWRLSPGSYVLLTSVLDGGQQRLDAGSLELWRGGSAYFNGDSVLVEFYAAEGAPDDFIRIEEITVGEWPPGTTRGGCTWPCGTCGADERVPSSDPRVARAVPAGCTAWLVSNGAALSAGHCEESAGWQLQVLQFNVPLSTCSGGLVMPPPEDQYPVIESSIVWTNTTGYDDWAVFRCGPNSNTGLLPVHAQGAFFRMQREQFPLTARVTGYGLDNDPPGCTGGLNDRSQTQQTDLGGFAVVSEFDPVALQMEADVGCGNSGSPVIDPGGVVAFGIFTECAWPCVLTSHHGTGFANDGLSAAITTFPGPVVRYVDAGHPVSAESGSPFRPFNRVPEALSGATSGTIISIVAGDYPAAAGNTFTAGADGRAMTLQAPVGPVRIGN